MVNLTEETHKTCRQCASSIVSEAKICPVCQSHQDWRAYLSLGNSTLALIIAAASVLALTSKQITELFLPTSSEVKLYLENTTQDSISFIANNTGKTGGVVTLNSFSIGIQGNQESEIIISIPPKGQYVKSKSEERIIFNSYPKMPNYICQNLRKYDFFDEFGEYEWDKFDAEDRSVIKFDTYFSMNKKLECSVNLDIVDSNNANSIGPLGLGDYVHNIKLDCTRVQWVSDCLSMAMTVQK